MKKKAQLAIFLIASILIIILGILAVYLIDFSAKDVASDLKDPTRLTEISKETKEYIESCISLTSNPLIETIAKKGGTFAPGSRIFYNNQELNVFCTEIENKGCVNNYISREKIENELNEKIKIGLEACIDLNTIKIQGLEVDAGEINVDANIRRDDVLININYPLKLSLKDSHITIEEFSNLIKFPFGRLYGLAVDITNSEIEDGFFNKDEWVISHGLEIVIEKHRPYPDTVYILTKEDKDLDKEFVFQFALKGYETVGDKIIKKPLSSVGCCINSKDNFCFKNTPQVNCDETYNANLGCSCQETTEPIYEGCCVLSDSVCAPSTQDGCAALGANTNFYPGDFLCSSAECGNLHCQQTYIYSNHTYTGPPKKNGESWCVYDAAAGHGFDYVGSRHYLHTCINGQEIVEECRDFREELCTETNTLVSGKGYTKANCRINRWYDCALQNSVNSCLDRSQRDCMWLSGRLLNRPTRCVPFVPPGFKFWEGNGQSVCSFASENPTDYMRYFRPRTWGHSTVHFCQRMGDCGNYRNIADEITKFGYFNPLGQPQSWVYLDPGLINEGHNFVVDLPLDTISLADSVAMPQGPYGSYAICNVWKAPPHSNNCEICDDFEFKPCTEYKCKSLGRQCVFNMENGIPSCTASGIEDDEGPEISFDASLLSPGFNVEIAYNDYFEALENSITPLVNPHTPLTFGFTTSKPARCRLSLQPPLLDEELLNANNMLANLPEIWLSNDYRESHSVTLRFPPDVIDTDLLEYLLFASCEDELGNENTGNFYISVGIIDPPIYVPLEIIGMSPKPETLTVNNEETAIELYVNKPFKDCKYSNNNEVFDSMQSLECNSTIGNMQFVPFVPYGSFVCNGVITLDSSNYFFNCKDWEDKVMQNNYAITIS